MEKSIETNHVLLCGTLAGPPRWSHETRGQDFFTFPLEIRRLSGTPDVLRVIARRDLLEGEILEGAQRLRIEGELRSFNDHRGTGPRLIVSVYARELGYTDEEDQDRVSLRGTICRPPALRRTPLGREICDLMLAVQRHYGRSDYLPCICWGTDARRASAWQTGQQICLNGRIQSRDYIKQTPEGPQKRTTYEVSASEIDPAEEDVETYVESLRSKGG